MPNSNPDVSVIHPDLEEYLSIYESVRDVIQGEKRIKERGIIYCPKLGGQDSSQYASYVERGSFFNAFSKTISGTTGLAVRRDYQLLDAPTALRDILPTISNESLSLSEVIRDAIYNIIGYGRYGILVDYDEFEKRPYFASYDAMSIGNWMEEQQYGKIRLRFISLKENNCEIGAGDNPYEVCVKEQIRVLYLDDSDKCVSEVYVQSKDTKTGEKIWVLNEEPKFPSIRGKRIDFIPFSPIGVLSNNMKPDKPPLLDLLNLNLHHWRLSVDYAHGLHYCALPTPWAAGFDMRANLSIGPGKAWRSEDPDARCGYLEFSGQGLSAVSTALKEVESQMAVIGARLLEQQKRAAEAYQTLQLRASADTATLSNITLSVEKAVVKALTMANMWMSGKEEEIKLELNKDFLDSQIQPELIAQLLASLQSGAISLNTFLFQMKAGEILPDDVSIDDEMELIANEQESFSGTMTEPEEPEEPEAV